MLKTDAKNPEIDSERPKLVEITENRYLKSLKVSIVFRNCHGFDTFTQFHEYTKNSVFKTPENSALLKIAVKRNPEIDGEKDQILVLQITDNRYQKLPKSVF